MPDRNYGKPWHLIRPLQHDNTPVDMGLTRERGFDNPAALMSILDYITGMGWHRVNSSYIIRHTEQLSENIVFSTTDGCGILELGGISYRIPQNSITVIPKHAEVVYYTDPNAGHWEFYWMHVRGVNVTNVLRVLFRNNVYVIPLESVRQFESIYEDILTGSFIGNEMTLYNSRKISELLHLFVEATVSKGIILADNNDFVKTVVRFIENNYPNHISSSDIAKSVYLSEEYTIRTFKRLTGYTPHAYLKKYRLMKACDYLSDTSLSVKVIAQLVGYKSESNFIAEFKSQKGITPGQFRKNK